MMMPRKPNGAVALARKPRMAPISAADIPVVSPYGCNLIQKD